MNETRKRILDMLADQKISAEEADRLLEALGSDSGAAAAPAPAVETPRKGSWKYLRVTVTPGEGAERQDKVNVRVPMSLIRAGIKLTSLIPPQAQDKIDEALKEKGINFDIRTIKKEDLEELIEALADMEVNVDGHKGEKVRVYVE
jgi:hypothetical protein